MKHGTNPAKLDRRDYSFHRTFPQFAAAAPPILPNMEYSLDAGLDMPDQVADGYDFGCTGYTQTNCKQDQDKVRYDPGFTYEKTCDMEGHGLDRGCDIRNSAKSLRVYGALRQGEGSDEEAAKHRSGQDFSVDKAPGRDWFDSFRITLRAQRGSAIKHPISIGTIWFSEWHGVPQSGLLTEHFTFDGDITHYLWHNYKISGEKMVGGEATLEVKSWQGRSVGNGGWLYMNRATFNKAFDSYYGTLAITQAAASEADIRTIKLDMLQTLLVYLNRMLALIGQRLAVHA